MDPTRPDYICKLHKEIYGLKQVLRAWFAQLSSWLINYSFIASQADPSLFILHHGDIHIYLLIYVDDIVITAPKPTVIDVLITDLSHFFLLKDLGKMSYFLGVEVDYTSTGLILSQWQYIKNLLLKSNMFTAKPISLHSYGNFTIITL